MKETILCNYNNEFNLLHSKTNNNNNNINQNISIANKSILNLPGKKYTNLIIDSKKMKIL
jgi:hypothetical protein